MSLTIINIHIYITSPITTGCIPTSPVLLLLLLRLAPAGKGGGAESFQAGCILARAFFMKRRSTNGLRVPKNGFQRAQKPAIWRPKRPPRHPKRHLKTADKQTPRDPSRPERTPPQNRPAAGSGPRNTAKFDHFWGFPLPHTPLVQISKAGPGRKLRAAFVIIAG